MEITKLSKKHIEEIVAFFKSELGQDAWNLQQIESAFNSNSTFFYGVYVEQELICLASALVSIDDINILDIATKKTFRRKGYAKRLLKYIIDKRDKNQSVSLEVRSKNIPAISLYKSLGFVQLHTRKHYYKDGDDALCLFLLCD